MNKIILIILFIASYTLNAQYYSTSFGEGRFGVSVGATSFDVNTNFLSVKPSVGFMVGVTGTIILSDNMEIYVGINYNRHNLSLLGRENELAKTEYIKYHLDIMDVPVALEYLFLIKDNFRFGAEIGPAISFFHSFELNNYNHQGYYINPANLRTSDLLDDGVAINTYAFFGLSTHYKSFRLNARYNKGLSSPYRNLSSPYMYLKGKDNFTSITLTYFFGDD